MAEDDDDCEDSPPIGAWQLVTRHFPLSYPNETQLSLPTTDGGRAYRTSASPVVAVIFRVRTPVKRIAWSGVRR